MNRRPSRMSRAGAPAQSGFSIIELMVAVTLGLILIAGVASVFVSSKQGYRVQESSSRMQESGRFAMEYMSRAIRMDDFWGGVDPKSNPGSVAYASTLASAGGSATCGSVNDWVVDPTTAITGYTSVGGTGGLPSDCLPSDGTYITGSDALVLRFANPDSWLLTSQLTSPPSTITSNGNYFVRTKAPDKAVIFDIDTGGDVTTATTDGATGISGDKTSDGVFNYQYTFMAFSLENVTVGGTTTPELFVYRTGDGAMQSLMIAQGVEMLKFEYGLDANTTSGQYDYVVGKWVDAGSVTDWSKVLAVRISMVVRGDALDNYVDSQVYNLTDSFCYGPASSSCTATYDATAARYPRRVLTQIVQIRNRMRQ